MAAQSTLSGRNKAYCVITEIRLKNLRKYSIVVERSSKEIGSYMHVLNIVSCLITYQIENQAILFGQVRKRKYLRNPAVRIINRTKTGGVMVSKISRL